MVDAVEKRMLQAEINNASPVLTCSSPSLSQDASTDYGSGLRISSSLIKKHLMYTSRILYNGLQRCRLLYLYIVSVTFISSYLLISSLY